MYQATAYWQLNILLLLLLLATNKQQTIPAIKICGRVSLVVPQTSLDSFPIYI
jgi:hypothetical protein